MVTANQTPLPAGVITGRRTNVKDEKTGLTLYYVETWAFRYIFPAENTRDARLAVIYEFHDDGCRLIRPATQEDIDSLQAERLAVPGE